MRYFFFLSLFLSMIACSTSKKKENTESNRLTVSFFSIGEGIDINAKKVFISHLERQEIQLKFKMTNWGREGETDYCFQLNELNKKEQVKFIKEIKQVLMTAKHVRITENEACKTR